MGHRYAEIMFTPEAEHHQSINGSRESYARMVAGKDRNGVLTAKEVDFITTRDSFYIATVNPDGWPYLQHRGGVRGFVRVLDEHTLAFPDFSGNRQYLTTSNLDHDSRVSLFFMDYARRRRLKLLGRAQYSAPKAEAPQSTTATARVERTMEIEVVAFDWNCPQHITPRYSAAELQALGIDLESALEN